MYQMMVLGAHGKGHLVAHYVDFCVIEPRGGYVCPLVCIKIVCVMCGLRSIATSLLHCAKLRLIQAGRRRIYVLLSVKEVGADKEWRIVNTCIALGDRIIRGPVAGDATGVLFPPRVSVCPSGCPLTEYARFGGTRLAPYERPQTPDRRAPIYRAYRTPAEDGFVRRRRRRRYQCWCRSGCWRGCCRGRWRGCDVGL